MKKLYLILSSILTVLAGSLALAAVNGLAGTAEAASPWLLSAWILVMMSIGLFFVGSAYRE